MSFGRDISREVADQEVRLIFKLCMAIFVVGLITGFLIGWW